MDDAILQVRGLRKTYRSGDSDLTIFQDLDLDIRRGEMLALVGESGAGKSTLLYLLSGLDRPSGGSILYNGRDLAAMPDAELAAFRNKELGFVWQSHNLLPEFTARENVMMPLLVRGVSEHDASAAAQAGLDEAGIGARSTHRAGELSGGEQQRVALARALSGAPSVLLADEPTGNLDHKTGEMIFALLRQLQKRRGLTLVLVTHNESFAGRCDRVLRLVNGGLVAGGAE